MFGSRRRSRAAATLRARKPPGARAPIHGAGRVDLRLRVRGLDSPVAARVVEVPVGIDDRRDGPLPLAREREDAVAVPRMAAGVDRDQARGRDEDRRYCRRVRDPPGSRPAAEMCPGAISRAAGGLGVGAACASVSVSAKNRGFMPSLAAPTRRAGRRGSDCRRDRPA